jgi:hypothetical protein
MIPTHKSATIANQVKPQIDTAPPFLVTEVLTGRRRLTSA